MVDFETHEEALTWMRVMAAEHLRARGAPMTAAFAMRAGGEEPSVIGRGRKGVRELRHYLTLHLGAAAPDPDPAMVARIAAAVAVLDPAPSDTATGTKRPTED